MISVFGWPFCIMVAIFICAFAGAGLIGIGLVLHVLWSMFVDTWRHRRGRF